MSPMSPPSSTVVAISSRRPPISTIVSWRGGGATPAARSSGVSARSPMSTTKASSHSRCRWRASEPSEGRSRIQLSVMARSDCAAAIQASIACRTWASHGARGSTAAAIWRTIGLVRMRTVNRRARMTTVTLPDGPSLPRFVQGGMALAAPLWTMRRLRERYGSAFTVDVPIFGKAVVISDPAEVKQLFTTSPEIADNLDLNLGRVLGPNSFFAISGDAHKQQRKLLVPPFHGRRLRAYEAIVEEEAVREMATWPEGAEFATLDSMMRITLNAILRAVFGADGAELAELRELLPAMVKLGSRLAVLPIPRTDLGRWSPWGRGLA